MATEQLSYCRICAAACGITVTTDDQRVIRVRGDAEHPYSRGYICAKARGLPEWHHSPRRLDQPRLIGRNVTWDVLLDDLAGRLRTVIDSGGSRAVALYLATGLAYDSGGQIAAGMWMGAIGSTSFYTAATIDNAPVLVAAELVTGHPMLNPVWNPDEPGLLVLVGTNPVVSHGYGTTLPDPVRRLREFRGSGGRIWVVDPRRSESAALADEHLAIRPGADVSVLAALVRSVLVDGVDPTELCDELELDALRAAVEPFTIERAAAAAGVAARRITALAEDIRSHRGRLAIFCGTGTTMAADGVITEWLRWALLVLTGSLDRPGGMRFNRGIVNRPRPPHGPTPKAPGPTSRPELPRVAGQVPAVALIDEIEAGNVRALVVTGGNPLTAFPEPDRLRAALRSLDVLAVIDVMESELVDIATHVLAATGQLERADLSLAEHVSIRSGIQFTPPVVDPVADRRPVWWMLGGLAQRLGVPLMGGDEADLLDDTSFLCGILAHTDVGAEPILSAGPRGLDIPIEFGWVRNSMLPRGRWNIAPPELLERLAAHVPPATTTAAEITTQLVLTPRREMAWSNSVRFAGQPSDTPTVRMSAIDAASAGAEAGNTVSVASAHGTIEAVVEIDDSLRRGVVSMSHGRGRNSTSRLTSSHVDIDPLTTMPLASGLPVTVGIGPH